MPSQISQSPAVFHTHAPALSRRLEHRAPVARRRYDALVFLRTAGTGVALGLAFVGALLLGLFAALAFGGVLAF